MKFICINTAGDKVELLVYNNKKISFKSDGFKKASETLFVFLDELLQAQNLKAADLDFIAVVSGPGSFTGIRIGLTLARTLAQALNKGIISVTYHKMLAYNNKDLLDTVVLTDAANGLVYASVFNKDKDSSELPKVLPISELPEFLSSIEQPYTLVTEEKLQPQIKIESKNVVVSKDNSKATQQAAIDEFNKNGTQNYSNIVPLYVRVSQAEANLKC